MATKKTVSMIHLTRAMVLVEKIEDPETQLELLATYLAPTLTLVKARTSPEALDDFISQAAEMTGEQGAELISDFLEQFGKYSASLLACGLMRPKPRPELLQSPALPPDTENS